MQSGLFEYPNELNEVFEKLKQKGARPIIVGGFVRDSLMGQNGSKDIDVEVYNIESYKKLTEVLAPFGSTCLVGESFGVCKLKLAETEYDFSLPRKENKTAKGHRGFSVTTDPLLSFKEAARRRDFTINAMGYDVTSKKLLDCFGGLEDLQNKTLKAVDPLTFTEDPLRVLRAMQFLARFEMTPHESLVKLCSRLVQSGALEELPKERIFEEFKKLFLKSTRPSVGIEFLRTTGENRLLKELFSLPKEQYQNTLLALDRVAKSTNKELYHYWGALLFYVQEPLHVMERFSNDKRVLQNLRRLLEATNEILTLCKNGYNDFEVSLLSTLTDIEEATDFVRALFMQHETCLQEIANRAKKLGVLHRPPKPIANGTMLIQAGLSPSKEFSNILHELYILQLKGETIDENFVKKYIISRKKDSND